ncbi:DUF5722 domain-containing protein [Stieleria sp. ICT_E10.1]|uniref:DUF5722 domain-containing protein n=1 Tax=Stieleria sedimenti TaxID=2976331 RepID=UPI00217FC045|nr:DUF5722 domain-containing protein [Stieleria sedimenti]MCS7468939.1 DUF5722 domain-containing protein [Stieleria sedimenti]
MFRSFILTSCLLISPWVELQCLANEGGQVAESSTTVRATHHLDWSGAGDQANQLRVSQHDGVVSFLTLGNDPFFRFELPRLPATERDWMLELDYFCPDGIRGIEWRSGRGIHRPAATSLPSMPNAEGWTKYAFSLNELAPGVIDSDTAVPVRIDLGSRSGIQLQVRGVVVRPMNDAELRQREEAAERKLQKTALAHRINDYRLRRWPAKIDSIDFDGERIQVAGTLSPSTVVRSAFLIARHPDSVSADPPTTGELSQRWPVTIDQEGRRLTARIDSPVGASWLDAGVRFQLFQQTDDAATSTRPTPISAARYRDLNPDADVPPAKTLSAAKGLTCITSRFSPDQLRALGIQHASVNIVVSGLVSETARPGWEPFEINGRTWWSNQPRLRQQDRDIRTATDAGAVVAGILLIPTSSRGRSPIAHPESTDAGTYAMPNLTDRQAVARYCAALHVLGQRYSGNDSAHGRVDHWIVHNEVDYGWQWTNMGEQPIEVFLDHYVRSMRLVDAVTRSFNPHARAFISLTHRWNTTDNQHWRTYAPKELLERLIHDSRLEGDFPWGVAYHPYPQSLWKADFWNDTQVSDDLETRLITIKNLQVLDRFMHLPSSRTVDGRLRPVICSEQGFHADEDDPKQLRTQAAALLLTWKKLRQCPSIIAFDYHRPSDHPNEGGLRLGLRGLPSQTNPLGAEKPAWDVFSAIGTDREAEMIRRYQSEWEGDVGE